LLAGYIGSGNLGDDAIMLGFVHGLADSGFHCTVLSGSPEETYRHYALPAVQRRDFKAIEKAIEQSDALVFPGGSIFQDTTSVRSVFYYANLVKLAKKSGKKVIMVGQGVGPINSYLGKRLASGAFNAADAIAVRDPGSLTTLQGLGVKKNVKVTADLAFLLPTPTAPPGEEDEGYKVGNMRTIGIAPRPLGKGRDVAALFGDFCRLVYQSGTMPVLISMDRNEDAPLIQEISNKQGGKIPDLKKIATPTDLQKRVSRMDCMVAMRLHGGILAATVGVPPLLISYDPKVAAFAKGLGLGSALSLDGLTPQRMFEAFTAFYKDRDRNAKLLQRKREEMFNLAMQNVEIVQDVLGRSAKM
jgi:polysaccharide pyruvyl transferase CsaB